MKPRFTLLNLFTWTGMFAVLLAVVMWVSPNEITRAELDQVKRGMSKGQVLDLLGRPDDKSAAWGPDGEPREVWRYGIYGWELYFKKGAFEEATPF